MAVIRLSLTDFRSYAEARIEAGPGLVILTGENGAGKTNVLEAVSLLSPGRGLRGARLGEMARRGGDGGFAVAARMNLLPNFREDEQGRIAPRSEAVSGGHGDLLMGVGRARERERSFAGENKSHPQPLHEIVEGRIDIGTGALASAPERRLVRINGAPASANALSEWLSVLWLTPAMDRLFADTTSGRRRFLDRLVLALDPAHAGHSARYETAMRARSKLLAEESPDADWLSALEARMAEHGAVIAETRAAAVAALAERLDAAPEGPFARAMIALEGGDETDLTVALKANRSRDAAAGRALAGPHRADLLVTHCAKNQPAGLCSTGEQKALLIGLILAHADLVAERAGRRPILLLDEIAAHLDPLRREALFERLASAGGQVWMTGTEPALFSTLGAAACRFEIAGGAITRA